MNVMIVGDNARVRNMIKQTIAVHLEDVGTIYECVNGNEAVERYHKFQPDWVVMDIQMEPVDSLMAAKIIWSSYPDAKIIILSEFGDVKYRAAGGVYAYVLKENLRELPGITTKGPSPPNVLQQKVTRE